MEIFDQSMFVASSVTFSKKPDDRRFKNPNLHLITQGRLGEGDGEFEEEAVPVPPEPRVVSKYSANPSSSHNGRLGTTLCK